MANDTRPDITGDNHGWIEEGVWFEKWAPLTPVEITYVFQCLRDAYARIGEITVRSVKARDRLIAECKKQQIDLLAKFDAQRNGMWRRHQRELDAMPVEKAKLLEESLKLLAKTEKLLYDYFAHDDDETKRPGRVLLIETQEIVGRLVHHKRAIGL